MNKIIRDLKEAILAAGMRDGMTISFHHHLRNGDFVLNKVLSCMDELGFRNIRINASSLFDVHAPLLELIRRGVVTHLECNYMGAKLGQAISRGCLNAPVIFRTHGGRPADIASGASPIDIAFIAAPAADEMGNLSGKYGPSACGSLGYAFADARFAKRVIAVTDHLTPYPLSDFSIPETEVDFVVEIERIGNPEGIVSGTTRITRDPIGLLMAEMAVRAIEASGLLKEGFSFQTGAGGASLASAAILRERMLARKIKGSFAMGGITATLVQMLEDGCFDALMDVQCFDLEAVRSIRENPRHREVSALHYAAPRPIVRSALVDQLDVVLLGATELDRQFNVNVHSDSNGSIMGGSGGHSDTAAGAKMAIIIAPLIRGRLPLIVDRLHCVSTPGESIDVLITQAGLAVHPRREDLRERFRAARLPLFDIEELQKKAEALSGKPRFAPCGERVVGQVRYRDGSILSELREVGG